MITKSVPDCASQDVPPLALQLGDLWDESDAAVCLDYLEITWLG